VSTNETYEGKAKILFPLKRFQSSQKNGSIPKSVPKHAWVQHFKDDLTAFDATKKDNKIGKGVINQHISQMLYTFLEGCGFKTHFITSLDETHQAIHRLEMIPVECVVRRVATGSLVKRIGVEEGKKLHPPLFELFLKDDALHDPILTREHARLVRPEVTMSLMRKLELLSLSIFGHLTALFDACELELIDGKFEFGLLGQEIILGDEITPDTLRIWKDGRKLDKDVFRHDLGNVLDGYEEIRQRLTKQNLAALVQKYQSEGIQVPPYRIICEVLPQEEVLDPEGQAIQDVLKQADVKGLQEVKLGKHIALEFNRVLNGSDWEQLEKLGSQLLANPLIQQWQFYLERV
jgi:phosphoribosylaminoimidazole-succinocarboxamide synthase